MSISYAGYRTGFPFPIRTKNELGLPIDVWDGYTYYNGYIPSGSASQFITVVGPGSGPHSHGYEAAHFAELVWRIKSAKISFNIAHTGSGSGALTMFVDTAGNIGKYPVYIKRDGRFPFDESSYVDKEWILHTGETYDFGLYPDALEGIAGPDVGYWNGTISGNPASGDMNLYGRMSVQINYPNTILADDGKYYPEIQSFNAAGASGFFSPPPGLGISTSYAKAPGHLSLDANIFGVIAPGWLLGGAIGSFGLPIIDGSASGSGLLVEADEYFPYNGKWNTSTGAPN